MVLLYKYRKTSETLGINKKGASVVNNYSYLKNPELKILCFLK